MIYDNQILKSRLREYLQVTVSQSNFRPQLTIALTTSDLASQKYTQLKAKVGTELGFGVSIIGEDKVDDFLLGQTQAGHKTGFIMQIPAMRRFEELLKNLSSWQNLVDVDFLSPLQEISWQRGFLPPTIQAIDLVLKTILLTDWPNRDFGDLIGQKLDFQGQTVAVIGQGKLVGKFALRYLADRGATVISINHHTLNAKSLVVKADIVVSAAGVAGLVKSDWLRDKTVIIDAATSESDGTLTGDVDIDDLKLTGKLDRVTLVKSPGGIGPITVLCLFYNLLAIEG